MAETLTNGTTQTDTTSAADKAVAASNEAKAAADKAAADKTAASIAAAKPDFAAEEARIAALPEAERAAATEKLAADKKAADTIATGSKVVPDKEIKYDLKLPAGSTLGAAFVERTAAIARGLGLDQSGAEKLLSARADEYDTTVKALTPPDKDGKNAGPLWIAREEGFRTEAFKDKAFGNGDQKTFDIAVEKAQHGLKVLDRTGTLGPCSRRRATARIRPCWPRWPTWGAGAARRGRSWLGTAQAASSPRPNACTRTCTTTTDHPNNSQHTPTEE